jgi:hypothetical protein
MKTALIACAVVFALTGPAFAEETPARGCPTSLRTEVVPLPIYATLPNEGDTFGAMPVFLRICRENGTTSSIIAPSLTWNAVIRWTGTLRYFHYPSEDQTLTLIVSASTRINSGVLFTWLDLPRKPGTTTDEVEVRWQRSAFFRFFGFGFDTKPDAETSYTRARVHAIARRGINFDGSWNAGASISFDHDEVQDLGVPGLLLSRRVFPGAPGMGGSTALGQGADLRFDTRPRGEYSEEGFYVDFGAGVVEGIAGTPWYLRGRIEMSALWREAGPLNGAAHLEWHGVSSADAPFYQQSTLGGAYLLRGFTEDRFVDQQAWTVEAEQRIRVFQSHIYGVTADWRLDPFIAFGQVFGGPEEALTHPRVAAGVGFRALVRPNVLGRVDVATGGEGWKVYVEIGYPY